MATGVKRKLDTPEIPRKRLKKQIKRIIKSHGDIKRKTVRRKLEVVLNLPKKALDPRKLEINSIIGKVRIKLSNGQQPKSANAKKKAVIQEKNKEQEAKAEEKKIEQSNIKEKKVEQKPPIANEESKPLSDQAKQWRIKHNVTVEDKVDLSAFESFSEIPVEARFSDGYKGFETPTPIQAQSWPYTLPKGGKQGRDCIGIAETGSGKTLAFILPGLLKLFAEPVPKLKRKNPRAMVLAPTRELANQIETTLSSFRPSLDVKSICVYGGVDKWPQLKAIRAGVDFVVATPGRLLGRRLLAGQ